jgi:1-acyl-sn-glycerol-3-phosphate acyltransferase
VTAKRERAPAIYRVSQWIARTAWRSLAGLEVRGLANVPASGPFLLVANHESNLDPILIQAVCSRPVHAMAKSSQFLVPLVGLLMKLILAFPVRRYQVDPHAVRLVLRRIGEGKGVAVYIEGERSWDGRLQSARPGTVRLALKAGVPVVPCGIAGSYEAWPRWAPRPQLLPIRITFGVPMRFAQLDRRADREAALADATTRIMSALRKLSEGSIQAV